MAKLLQRAFYLLIIVQTAYLYAGDMQPLMPVPINSVKIQDPFWSPKLEIWSTVTLKDVLDKFEEAGAFRNFDRVAGKLEGSHEGPPWFDGLIYETIRAASDFLISHPDKTLQARIDGYIQRITDAQDVDAGGYVMTYTQLEEPDHRWGLNGGFLRWQHDVYNAGALVEAGVHYYRATGKTNLLRVAVKFANHMSDIMGPPPGKNIIPAHALSEEALVELYLLCRDDPSVKDKIDVPINEKSYRGLAEFWLEARGRHCGQPTSEQWDNHGRESEQWVRQQKYGDQRPCWGQYDQDHQSVFEQETIEGHAVRATLMCTGLSAAARVNAKPVYAEASRRLWENMVGRRIHITGGVGAFAHEEKFGPDYTLPNDAYLETCAAVGAGFFHRNMNLLFKDAGYVDELERVLYNNVINGVSLEGNRYYYQNPLSANDHRRWKWHGCPCCPPMFLKMVSALPGYIYAYDEQGMYVNLFIGSTARIPCGDQTVTVIQETEYPWKGQVKLLLQPQKETEFALNVRMPGWARGQENPFGLYRSDLSSPIRLSINGKQVAAPDIRRGYAVIRKKWKPGDQVVLELPMQPRRVLAHPKVQADEGRVALQAGPLVYCLEQQDNPQIHSCFLKSGSRFIREYEPDLLGGINVIKADAFIRRADGSAEKTTLTAIPFYCQDNRPNTAAMEVWLPAKMEVAHPAPLPTIANQSKISVSHCFGSDTKNALNDGIEPANSNDHAIPRHTWWDHRGTTEWAQYEFNQLQDISLVSVYWWDDRPAGGQCAVPESWRLFFRNENGRWDPIPGAVGYGIQKDQYNTTRFKSIHTDALRIEAKLAADYSAGILEWKVQ